jgi:hypothetical protein
MAIWATLTCVSKNGGKCGFGHFFVKILTHFRMPAVRCLPGGRCRMAARIRHPTSTATRRPDPPPSTPRPAQRQRPKKAHATGGSAPPIKDTHGLPDAVRPIAPTRHARIFPDPNRTATGASTTLPTPPVPQIAQKAPKPVASPLPRPTDATVPATCARIPTRMTQAPMTRRPTIRRVPHLVATGADALVTAAGKAPEPHANADIQHPIVAHKQTMR